jgi:hypothetical protein
MGAKENDPGTIPRSPVSCLGPFIKLSIFKDTVQVKHGAFFTMVREDLRTEILSSSHDLATPNFL